jgi:hypothetical protein
LSTFADQPAASLPDAGVPLEALDRDGALLEGIADVYGESRARFVARLGFGGAALLAAFTGAPEAIAGRRDTNILNFDLVFEYLQSSFYVGAVRVGTVARMPPEQQRWAKTLGAHELAHVRILKQVLGRQAAAKPTFDFHGVTESVNDFTRTAVAMEDLTTALLAGQAPQFENPQLVSAAFSLLTTEARHAAWARRLAGTTPVRSPFDAPKSLAAVDRAVRQTRFIASRPRTRRKGRPRYIG